MKIEWLYDHQLRMGGWACGTINRLTDRWVIHVYPELSSATLPVERELYATEQEAKDALVQTVTVLIIGGCFDGREQTERDRPE